jgi:serralysin
MKIEGTQWGDLITPWSWFKHSTSNADQINGYGGWDWLDGGAGNDTIDGGSGNDKVLGGSGSDELYGGRGNDKLHGGSGRDILDGGSGDDLVNGGSGQDLLTGGAGADAFVFDTKLGRSNVDIITDFDAEDGIVLSSVTFNGLWPGGLSADQFHAAAGATGGDDAEDRIVYDTATGNLYYDRDGSGSAAAVQFAVLSGAPALSSEEFWII